MTSYTATTTNDIDEITATPADEGAEVVITVNGDEVDNESPATWGVGVNVVVITVTNGDAETVYTVTVTKTNGG